MDCCAASPCAARVAKPSKIHRTGGRLVRIFVSFGEIKGLLLTCEAQKPEK
jgi:hypothetical protein